MATNEIEITLEAPSGKELVEGLFSGITDSLNTLRNNILSSTSTTLMFTTVGTMFIFAALHLWRRA